MKLELLVPRVLQAHRVKWEPLARWVLLGCLAREDALDQVVSLENVAPLATSESLVQWVPWVLVDHLDIQGHQE